jgi:hypothetical protein
MKTRTKTHTKGNVIVEDIKIGDIHYEYEYGIGIEVEVISEPVKNDKSWTWKSVNKRTGKEIDYSVTEGLEHYSANLYDYKAYMVKQWI